MTANQVNYAMALTGQQNADENIRHNEAMEKETNRHNLAVEQLENQSLQLQQDRLNYETIWNNEKNRIQEDYNRKYLELEQASLDQKQEIQDQLNNLKQQEINNLDWYNQRKTELEALRQGLDLEILKENERHNMEMESIGKESNANQQWLNERNQSYLRYQTDLNDTYRWGELDLKRDLYLLDEQRLRLDTNIKNYYKKLDTAKTVTEGFKDVMMGAYQGLQMLTPLMQSSSPVRAFNKLFK